jgi:hypothetical protein
VYLQLPKRLEKCLGQYNSFSKDLVEKKLNPHKASTFPHLQKKFQKITLKIEIIGTCPNFQLTPPRDFGPLGKIMFEIVFYNGGNILQFRWCYILQSCFTTMM